MEFGPYAGFILGAYGFATLVIVALVLHALRDSRAQRRALAELQGERRGDGE